MVPLKRYEEQRKWHVWEGKVNGRVAQAIKPESFARSSGQKAGMNPRPCAARVGIAPPPGERRSQLETKSAKQRLNEMPHGFSAPRLDGMPRSRGR